MIRNFATFFLLIGSLAHIFYSLTLKEEINKLQLELETHKINTTQDILFLNQECNYTLNQSNLLLEEILNRNK